MENVIDWVKPCIKCGAQERYATGLCRPCHKVRRSDKGLVLKPVKAARKLVHGVGVYAAGKYVSKINGKPTKEYGVWVGMLQRCYSEKSLKRCPTYLGCTVSECFKDFQWFMRWAEKQVGFGVEGFQLDKDLLVYGNKVYGENTCLFVPRQVNCLLVASGASRGEFPLGVVPNGKGYIAKCSNGTGRMSNLGTFPTPELAFERYKNFKEAHIKVVAEQWRGQVDPRVYAALMAYEVLITD